MNVDPYTQPLPKTITDKNGNPSREFFQWLVFDNRWKFDIWNRTGGGTDAIDAGQREHGYSENLISLLIGQVAFLKERVDALEKESPASICSEGIFSSVTVTASYTAADFDFVSASQGATITLPQYPSENSVIIVRNGNGSIISVSGNGRNINGTATVLSGVKNTTMVFHYFIDSNEWFIR